MKSQKFGSPLSETEQVIREEEENVEETKTITPRAREVPLLLTRNFSPVKVPSKMKIWLFFSFFKRSDR